TGRAKFRLQFAEVFARVLASAGGDLGCKQIHNHAIFVCRPHGAVLPQETCPGTLLSSKTDRTVKEPRHKPLKPYRCLAESAAKLVHHAVDQTAADQRFADGGIRRPGGPVR